MIIQEFNSTNKKRNAYGDSIRKVKKRFTGTWKLDTKVKSIG
jgi:hypothetical protein